jgi:uncharacterized PurR-regulated membrane protein YhhQ (DUF165 family)
MSATSQDRWLLPRRQTEYPARDLVSEATLHARRETTFLVLGTMCLVAIAAMLLSGTARIIDVGATIEGVFPDVALPTALYLPLGVVPGVLSVIAVMLACELYGRRRAGGLVWAGVIAALALVGFAYAQDALDGGTATFAPAAAIAAYVLVANLVTLLFHDVLGRTLAGRHGIVRPVITTLVAQPLGWGAFAGVLYVQGAQTQADLETVTALALGAAAYTTLAAIVLAPAVGLAARTLAVFLRVARFDVTERAPIIIEELRAVVPPPPPPARRRAARASIEPFSSAEMQFFADGEATP